MYRPKSEYYELPNKYDETIVRLLVQSPTRMYVYWEVGNKTIENFSANKLNYNSCTPVLKVTNITLGYSYEIEIDPYANNYYIDVKDANCKYKVEIGRKNHDKFIGIYESNEVKIPRSMPVFAKEAEEIIYRNYIKMEETDKFIIYRKNSINHKQGYEGLTLETEENISSMSRYCE